MSPGSCRGRVLCCPHMPHPMLAMPSHVHPYPHGPSAYQVLVCPYTPSANLLQVFSFQVGRLVLLNKDYCLKTSSSSRKFRQGGNAWNLLDFDNQSAAIICVDTITYYSIPSVPSILEEVKTQPEMIEWRTDRRNLSVLVTKDII